MIPIPLAAAAGSSDLLSEVMRAGPMAKLVLLTLVLFSVTSWSVIAERWRAFRRAERDDDAFVGVFQDAPGLAAVQDGARELVHGPMANVFRAGFREISLNPLPAGTAMEGPHLDALERTLRKSAASRIADLERSLGFLATTASATPLIGLFGTVWGIMNAFRGIGLAGQASLAAYAPGIADALVATAAGLAAAIPAVIGYNHFLGRLRRTEARIDEFVADFIHRVQGRRS